LNLIGGKEEKEGEDYIPMTSDKPSGLDLEDFLPVSNEVYNFPFNSVYFVLERCSKFIFGSNPLASKADSS
jgi:hypothetical protein